MNYNEALKYALNGEAVFLVGSGFSADAENNVNGSDKNYGLEVN